jgi:1-deoxy-D-xylulose-5-phosphate synthase
MTWRSRICRCASRSTARVWSAPTGRRMRAASTSPISRPAQFRGDGGRRRGRIGPYDHTCALHDDEGPSRCAIRAATAPAWRCPRFPSGWRSARAGSCARARRSRYCRSARGSPMRWRRPTARGAGAVDDGGDLRFAKPLDERPDPQAAGDARSGDHGGGECGRRARRARADARLDEGLIDAGLKLRTLRLPDIFQDHDKPEKQYAEAGLDTDAMVEAVLTALRSNSATVARGARA